ncbi:hypothetical protein PU683_02105 [Kosakonia cowanii]|uniref:hypothetical protein n=1 Tax=Kosakonia cowanii TaxID=208223 RepID=UPI0023F6B2FD|nr:hypothetical protein [Kosakonia cowanii]MDF7758327.1 hypothetical protein [Kosakonia cowanii]
MKLLKENEEITLSGEEAVKILTDVEYILISLRDIARHYYDNVDGEITSAHRSAYCEETTRFIDENEITKKLASMRAVISEKFNLKPGVDEMDDIERELGNIRYWKPCLE